MLETIDTSMIDWSRAQFALTAIYHWLFVPLTFRTSHFGIGCDYGYNGDIVCTYRK